MHHLKSCPAVEPLLALVARMERCGIRVALGGSGLLAALGLADVVGDWDLTTDAELDAIVAALAGEPFTHKGSDALHADQKLILADGSIEVIVGFAFHTPRGVVRLATREHGRWNGIPLGSPEAWAIAYHLLGRDAKAEALWRTLAERGADPEAVAALLGQPLAPELAARLRSLPTSRSA
jgi:hypothetical protein